MAVFRTMMIIAALVLGWIAMRTETLASNTPKSVTTAPTLAAPTLAAPGLASSQGVP